jgi:hypothetical protein
MCYESSKQENKSNKWVSKVPLKLLKKGGNSPIYNITKFYSNVVSTMKIADHGKKREKECVKNIRCSYASFKIILIKHTEQTSNLEAAR